MTKFPPKTELSVIIPVYKGADYLPELLRAIAHIRDEMNASGLPLQITECICVNDAAVDHSLEVLQSLQESNSWLRILSLSRNFGQHSATVAGILHCSGDWVVTLDEDLQHDPKHIVPLLLQACRKKHDIVYAKATGAIHNSWYRNAASRWVKAGLARLADNRFINDFNSFRVMRGSVARAAASSCAPETYFDVALTWFTQNIGAVTFAMTDRRTVEGKVSGYRFRSLTKHAFRLMVTSDSRLLRFGARLGLSGMLVAAVLVLAIIVAKVFNPAVIPVQGWASTMVMLLAVNSLVALQCGIAMKYLSLILQRSQGRPTFFVVDRSGDNALLSALESFHSRCQDDHRLQLAQQSKHAPVPF